MNGNTKTVFLSLSEDGRTFFPLWKHTFPPKKVKPLRHHFPPFRARYLRLTFLDSYENGPEGRAVFYLREVEVYGRPAKETDAGTIAANDLIPPLDRRLLPATQRETVVTPLPPLEPSSPLRSSRALLLLRRLGWEMRTPLTVWIIGDGWSLPPDTKEPAYWQYWLEELRRAYHHPRVRVVSWLAPDLTTSQVLEQWREHPITLDPDGVLVALGAAEVGRTAPEDFRARLERIVQRLLKETEAALILVTPLPPRDSQREPALQPFAQMVEEVARRHGIAYVRTGEWLRANGSPSVYYRDVHHLNGIGHRLLGEALLRLFLPSGEEVRTAPSASRGS
jgi:hypothetical protein